VAGADASSEVRLRQDIVMLGRTCKKMRALSPTLLLPLQKVHACSPTTPHHDMLSARCALVGSACHEKGVLCAVQASHCPTESACSCSWRQSSALRLKPLNREWAGLCAPAEALIQDVRNRALRPRVGVFA
jgi:hypothetical protein